MCRSRILAGALLVLFLAAPALADWDPSIPAKWVRLPDLSPMGIDVNVSPVPGNFILADDFECTEAGAVTGIHIWGSWRDDYLPFVDSPGSVTFILSLHADIPASQNPDGYSMPGDVLWFRTFQPGEFTFRQWEAGLMEGWMDPPEEYFFPGDTVCWQYNFRIPVDEAFVQEGSPDTPVVYWLDVKAFPEDPQAVFGWKTTADHWNDDATYASGEEPYLGPWRELIYPPAHQMAGMSIDLAFVLEGEPQPEPLDFGDAPDGAAAPGYPTLLANNGAYHAITPNLFLGLLIDPESDGQPDASATGDDLANLDDEDGVVFTTPLYPGYPAQVDVTASMAGILDAWIDFDANQSWAEAADYILPSVPVVAGVNTFTFNVPAGATPAVVTFSRFRLSSAGGLPPDGPAPDGEVEDHRVYIDDKYTLKWIQNPDLSPLGIDVAACRSIAGDEYLLADDFLCTTTGPVTDFRIWGSWLNDYLPFGADPRAVRFVLSIHKDIPAGAAGEYSQPGEVLWWRVFGPEEFGVEPVAEQIEEGWMYPPEDYGFPADWTCWLYTFHVAPHLAFQQEGSDGQPIVYWLDLKAYPEDPEAQFGWKTALDHWNDDAVWGVGDEPYFGPWFELRYPPQHELWGQSIDLAFAILEDHVTATPDGPATPRIGLRQNVPNPFNPSTKIDYELPSGGGHVDLGVYDASGRRVRTLVDGFRDGGPHEAVWDGRGDDGRMLPSGVYFARLRADGRQLSVKMVLLR